MSAAPSKLPKRGGWLVAPAAAADKVVHHDALPHPHLLVILQDGRALVRALTTDARLTIGRDPGTHLALSWDSTASAMHAELELTLGMLTIEDHGLTNGTYVNGQRIDRRTRLTDRDIVRCGSTEILVRCPAPETAGGTVALPPVPDWTVLSPRERDCLLKLVELWPAEMRLSAPPSNEQLAAAVGVGLETLRGYMRETRAKLAAYGVGSTKEDLANAADASMEALLAAHDG